MKTGSSKDAFADLSLENRALKDVIEKKPRCGVQPEIPKKCCAGVGTTGC